MKRTVNIEDIQNEKSRKKEAEKYNKYVKEITPKPKLGMNMLKAFLCGGLICTISQACTNWFMSLGISEEDAPIWTMLVLILTAAILTGLNVYQKLTVFGGAGFIVPITGFANSVASTAIEFKKEGQVFGIGCKIFTIAGPVILYGILSSWALGVIYWICRLIGIV